ncbi:Hypothetical predicted protein [Octopus vulgaris]|uniref:Uncharacterized protein n=1 Tax=Octopus vulgaris TaxID=6645 RepID=A0AA36AWE7_OCTVU|nr:Hypothetical predicted protein [Octopus vulgaris]
MVNCEQGPITTAASLSLPNTIPATAVLTITDTAPTTIAIILTPTTPPLITTMSLTTIAHTTAATITVITTATINNSAGQKIPEQQGPTGYSSPNLSKAEDDKLREYRSNMVRNAFKQPLAVICDYF